jgi:hypothetical protein
MTVRPAVEVQHRATAPRLAQILDEDEIWIEADSSARPEGPDARQLALPVRREKPGPIWVYPYVFSSPTDAFADGFFTLRIRK